MKKLLAKIRKLLRDRRTRQIITRFVSITAAVVVFVTTYALVLPAITMESEAYCGIPAHQHSDDCYELQLTCEIPESPGHAHTDACYTVTPVLVCETEEHEHSVDNGCYDEEGNLICTKAEHTHNADDECYEEERVLTCEEVESEGHQHTEDCYEKVLTCGLEVHTHSTECYVNPASDGATTEAAVEASSGGASTGAASASTGVSSTGATEDGSVEYDFEEGSESASARDNSNTGATEASENASTALTTVENATAGVTADGHYIPQLNPVNFPTLLDSHTGIYYHAVEDGETVEDSTALTYDQWNRVDNDTELGTADLLRVYLAYTVPAGSLNTTNQVARYRLPGNLHLTDAQVNAINSNVNGIAGQYVDMSTLEILDIDKYYAYLGIEAVEGTRQPDQDPEEYLAEIERRTGTDATEYISALVRVEDVYNELNGEYEGTDLVVTFTPYSIEKNQHEYDASGQPTKAGEKIEGWLTLDFNMSQIDFSDSDITTFEREVETGTAVDAEAVVEDQAVDAHSVENDDPDTSEEDHTDDQAVDETGNTAVTVETVERTEKTADVVFVEEQRDENNHKIYEVSTTLTVVEETVVDVQTVEDQSEAVGEGATEEAATATTEAAVEDTTDESNTGETSASAEEDKTEAEEDKTETRYSDGTLTAEGDGYRITLDYTADAQIPDNAELKVSEITEESDPEAYEACLEAARQSINAGNAADGRNQTVDTAASRFFDIEIVAEEMITAASDDPTAESEETVADTELEEAVDNDSAEDAATVDETVLENDAEVDDTNSTEGEESAIGKAEEESEPATGGFKKIEPAAPVSVRIELFDTVSKTAVSKTVDEADSHAVDNENIENTADQQSAPTVLHFTEDGLETIESTMVDAGAIDKAVDDNQEVQDNESSQVQENQTNTADNAQAIQFDASSFSIYGVVYTTLSTTVLTASGETYEITVTYDGEAGIPEGSDLRVREISEKEEEYKKAKGLIEAASSTSSVDAVDESSEAMTDGDSYKNSDSEDTAVNDDAVSNGSDTAGDPNAAGLADGIDGMLAFDISIYDPDGNIVEPKSAVSVDINLISLPEGVDIDLLKDTMAVHHIVENDGKVKAVLVADTGIASEGTIAVDDGQAEAIFVTESFSVYTIKWGNGDNQQVRLHFVDESGTDLTTNHDVVFNGNTVNGSTVSVSSSAPGIFGSEGILNLEDFIIDGYTLSNTHKATYEDLKFPNNHSSNWVDSNSTYPNDWGRSDVPHTIIANELRLKNGKVQYRAFYTNTDKAGSGWYDVGYVPEHWEYDYSNSNPHGNSVQDSIPNNTDYYLVYTPKTGSNSGQQSGTPEDDDDGSIHKDKKLSYNDDGTYNLELSVSAPGHEDEDDNGVNVLIVLDVSSSMKKTPGGENITNPSPSEYNDPRSRMKQTKDAINDFVDLILQNNTNDNPDAVELALITFSKNASLAQGWTKNGTTFKQTVSGLTGSSGTNWAQALKLASQTKKDDGDPTYVLLITDGAPSQYWHTSLTQYYVDGEGCYLGARDEGRGVIANDMYLYGIFAFGSTTDQSNGYLGKLVNYAYDDESASSEYYEFVQSKTALTTALTKILKNINQNFAYTAVNYHDGIALDTTSTALSTNIGGNLGSITYSKTGGTTGDYTVVADSSGNAKFTIDGHTYDGTTETITYTKVTGSTTDTGGTGIVTQTNATTKVYSYTVGTGDDAKTYIMPIATLETDDATKEGDLNWDLSPLGLLEDGATYKISFVVWPNQEAYDYVADLNNGKKTWGVDSTPEPVYADEEHQTLLYYKNGVKQYPNIVYYPDSDTYAALTNTVQEVTYYTASQDTSSSSQGSSQTTTYDGQFKTYPPTPNPMPLTASKSEIEKLWNVRRDPGVLFKMLYGMDESGNPIVDENGDPVSTKFTITFDVKVDEEVDDADDNEENSEEEGVEETGSGAEGGGSDGEGGEGDSTEEDEPYMSVTLGWKEDEDGSNGHYDWDTTDPNYIEPVTYNNHAYTVGTRWATDFSIATGLMLSTARMNALGLDKNAYPSGTFNGTTYYVLEMGHDYTIDEKDTGYEFDFSAPTYHPMLVDGKLQNVNFTKNFAQDGQTVESVSISKMTNDPNGIGSLKIENTLRGYINLDKDVVDKDKQPMEDDTQFEYEVTLVNESPVFKGTHIPWYGISNLYYHDGDFNYYQAEQIMVEGEDGVAVPKAGELYLRDEDGNEYTATCPGTFDPNIIGPTTVTFTVTNEDEQTESKTIQLYGNQMQPSNGSDEKGYKTAKATLKIDQYQTLNIANVPMGTVYSIKESKIIGYDLIKVKKEIKLKPTDTSAESSTTYENGDVISSRTITGTIISNRDNHIVYTNQNKKVNITLQKVDGNGKDLEGAIFQLRVLKKSESDDSSGGSSNEGNEASGDGEENAGNDSSNEGSSNEGEAGTGVEGSGGNQSEGGSGSGDQSGDGGTDGGNTEEGSDQKKGVYQPAYEVEGYKEIKFNSGKTVKVLVEQEEGGPIEEIRNVDSIPLATIVLFEKTYTSTFATTVKDEEENEQDDGEQTGDEPVGDEGGEDDENVEYRMRLEGLPDGEYKLVELKAPDGYVILANEIEFKIQDYVMTLVTEEDTISLQQVAGNYNGTATVANLTVVNEAGAELPSCGGPGTRFIYLAGALLTLLGAVMLMGKKIRE